MKNFLKSSLRLGLVIALFASCKKSESSPKELEHQQYINSVVQNESRLSPKRKAQREKWISELQKNVVYQKLVDSAVVSVEYLPTLSLIADAIKNTSVVDGKTVFGISDDLSRDIEESPTGREKMEFVIPVAALSIPENGGMPKEIVKVFERYKAHYNFYGNRGNKVISKNGKQEYIQQSYNLSYVFVIFDPNNKKALDAIYESVKNGVSVWSAEDQSLVHGFMSIKPLYMDHLKNVYPESEYLLNVDYELTPDELYSNYLDNEVAADENFKGKKIAITGSITDIGKDITNKPYISFRVKFMESINCYFSKDNNFEIAKLTKGESVTIVGECEGLLLKNVILVNCKIFD